MQIIRSATVALLVPFIAFAQIRPSERGSVTQTIDGTKITIDYARPRGRNRDPFFGNKEIVQWNEVWTPGASDATTLELSKGIRLDGHSVPKGTYSVWMTVRPSGDWTFMLDPRTKLFHTAHPDSTAEQIRFPVHTTEAPYMDVVTWTFPELRNNGGVIAMQWGKTRVALRLDVEPTVEVTLPKADAVAYVGTWEITNDKGKVKEMRITHERDILRGYLPADRDTVALVRIAPDWFATGAFDEKGDIWEVYRPGRVLEFKRENGVAVSYEERDRNDKLVATGKRKPKA